MNAIDETIGPLARDPVCGRELAVRQATVSVDYEGLTYLFCSENCRRLFELRPNLFVSGGLRIVIEKAYTRRS